LEKDKIPHAVPLPHGVILFKNCLDEEEQIELINTSLKLAKESPNEGLLPKKKFEGKEKKSRSVTFLQLARLFKECKFNGRTNRTIGVCSGNV